MAIAADSQSVGTAIMGAAVSTLVGLGSALCNFRGKKIKIKILDSKSIEVTAQRTTIVSSLVIHLIKETAEKKFFISIISTLNSFKACAKNPPNKFPQIAFIAGGFIGSIMSELTINCLKVTLNETDSIDQTILKQMYNGTIDTLSLYGCSYVSSKIAQRLSQHK